MGVVFLTIQPQLVLFINPLRILSVPGAVGTPQLQNPLRDVCPCLVSLFSCINNCYKLLITSVPVCICAHNPISLYLWSIFIVGGGIVIVSPHRVQVTITQVTSVYAGCTRRGCHIQCLELQKWLARCPSGFRCHYS